MIVSNDRYMSLLSWSRQYSGTSGIMMPTRVKVLMLDNIDGVILRGSSCEVVLDPLRQQHTR